VIGDVDLVAVGLAGGLALGGMHAVSAFHAPAIGVCVAIAASTATVSSLAPAGSFTILRRSALGALALATATARLLSRDTNPLVIW
jgi:hypothetical protein